MSIFDRTIATAQGPMDVAHALNQEGADLQAEMDEVLASLAMVYELVGDAALGRPEEVKGRLDALLASIDALLAASKVAGKRRVSCYDCAAPGPQCDDCPTHDRPYVPWQCAICGCPPDEMEPCEGPTKCSPDCPGDFEHGHPLHIGLDCEECKAEREEGR
jgi:hypothetical protein